MDSSSSSGKLRHSSGVQRQDMQSRSVHHERDPATAINNSSETTHSHNISSSTGIARPSSPSRQASASGQTESNSRPVINIAHPNPSQRPEQEHAAPTVSDADNGDQGHSNSQPNQANMTHAMNPVGIAPGMNPMPAYANTTSAVLQGQFGVPQPVRVYRGPVSDVEAFRYARYSRYRPGPGAGLAETQGNIQGIREYAEYLYDAMLQTTHVSDNPQAGSAKPGQCVGHLRDGYFDKDHIWKTAWKLTVSNSPMRFIRAY